MKSRTLHFICSCILLSMTVGRAQEIHTEQNAANYSDEADSTSGWAAAGGTLIISNSTEAFSGSYCIKIEASGDGWRRATYSFPTEIGRDYQIKFHAKSASTSGPGFFVWEGFSNFSPVGVNSTNWTEYIFNLTADATSAILKVYSGNPSVAGDAIYLDNVSIKALSTDPPAGSTIRINAGGPAIIHDGKQFEADKYAVGGGTYSNTSAEISPLYQTEHSGSSRTFDYAIPVNNGNYNVTLHFAEIYWGATGGGTGGTGKRIFDVTLEGNLILDNYDIYSDVGPQTPAIKNFTVEITDGELNLNFNGLGAVGGVDQAKVSAIEVSPTVVGTEGPWTTNGPDIYYNGKVGIGTTDPGDWELAVDGEIRAKEIKVETDWADYVFAEGYDLPTLEEVECHIAENGHLMNIPSANEVGKNGIELGEMNRLLLEKIEELTLYTLHQHKGQKRMEREISELENQENN